MEERWQQFRSWVVAWLFFLSFFFPLLLLFSLSFFRIWCVVRASPRHRDDDVYGEQIKL
jgi:ABC-type spermidine/putrescine transport system permease subunit II